MKTDKKKTIFQLFVFSKMYNSMNASKVFNQRTLRTDQRILPQNNVMYLLLNLRSIYRPSHLWVVFFKPSWTFSKITAGTVHMIWRKTCIPVPLNFHNCCQELLILLFARLMKITYTKIKLAHEGYLRV